jgi:hypothetical protein
MAEVDPTSKDPETESPPSSSPLPPKTRDATQLQVATREIAQEMQMIMRAGPMPNPLLEKITSKQLDKLLEIALEKVSAPTSWKKCAYR